jgi:ubiquitin-protein ligase E3 C
LSSRHNYLHDLPSLDPELYRSLLFLKNYKGDLADLSVYFVVVNNEYGEQNEIELVEGGRDIQVTNSNVINYIYKVAHHRLNSQVAICLLSHCLVLWVIEMVSL